MDKLDHIQKKVAFMREATRLIGQEDEPVLGEDEAFGLHLIFSDIIDDIGDVLEGFKNLENPLSIKDVIEWAKPNPECVQFLLKELSLLKSCPQRKAAPGSEARG